ncbi:unnamed protein product, partial [Vitrella brassicaformis CCMP3155]
NEQQLKQNEKELGDLQAKKDVCQAENDALNLQIAALTEEATSLLESLPVLRGFVDEYIEDIKGLSEERRQLVQDLKALEEHNNELEQQLEAVRQQNQALKAAKQASSASVSHLKGLKKELEGSTAHLEGKIADLREKLDKQLSSDRCPNNPSGKGDHFCEKCPFAMIAYHQTDEKSAKNIYHRGVDISLCQPYIAGKGFYTTSREDYTHHKAHNRGFMVKLGLRLGRARIFDEDGRGRARARGPLNEPLDGERLKAMGYDSVIVAYTNFLEYIIYEGARAVPLDWYPYPRQRH